jgi:molecular chaperone GrpE
MAGENQNPEDAPQEPIRFTDKRRFDPETGEARHVEGEASAEDQEAAAGSSTEPADPVQDPLEQAEQILRDLPAEDVDPDSAAEFGAQDADDVEIIDVEAADAVEPGAEQPSGAEREAELQADLQRLQAEYVNYRRRVERDRAAERDRTIGQLITELMPVLDDIAAARQAGDLEEGPFAHIAGKLENTLSQQGLERIDEVGVPFDPTVHEAIMHQPHPEIAEDHVAVVLRAGYRHGDRVLRAAHVMVSSGAEDGSDSSS